MINRIKKDSMINVLRVGCQCEESLSQYVQFDEDQSHAIVEM